MISEGDKPTLCGAPHPVMPNVTCQRWGKCVVDWHAAAVAGPPSHWLEWGSAKPASGQPAHITGYHGHQPYGTTPP